MTLRQILKLWEKRCRERNPIIPITQDRLDTPVIFPDGSPVREVLFAFVGGQSCIMLSGEKE